MIELLTPDEMAECDRLAIAGGVAGIALMEKAGRAVADAVARHPLGTRVVVVAGPGNNGGDGFVAARRAGRARLSGARAAARATPARCKGDAAQAAQRWQRRDRGRRRRRPSRGAGVIVDALFGAGLNRAVEGAARAMIEAMNASGAPIIAVDLPSGINGASGAVMGAAVDARESVTFFRRKPGHVLLPGRLHAGTRARRRHRHSRQRARARAAEDVRQRPGTCGATRFRSRASTGTNIRAAMRSWCPAICRSPARRGSRRAARCGQGRASSRSQARARRSPSTRRRASP